MIKTYFGIYVILIVLPIFGQEQISYNELVFPEDLDRQNLLFGVSNKKNTPFKDQFYRDRFIESIKSYVDEKNAEGRNYIALEENSVSDSSYFDHKYFVKIVQFRTGGCYNEGYRNYTSFVFTDRGNSSIKFQPWGISKKNSDLESDDYTSGCRYINSKNYKLFYRDLDRIYLNLKEFGVDEAFKKERKDQKSTSPKKNNILWWALFGLVVIGATVGGLFI